MTLKYNRSINFLSIAYVMYGIVSFTGQRILSALTLKEKIDLAAYQRAVYNFRLSIGILATLSLILFFAMLIKTTKGSMRTGAIIGSVSSLSPLFDALSTTILFKILRLPSLGAGSVIGSAAAALLMSIPCFIMLLIFSREKGLKSIKKILLAIFSVVTLLIAFFPVTSALISLVIMPGNPATIPLMQISAYTIHLRPIVIGGGLKIRILNFR